jgi:hypothetical protein
VFEETNVIHVDGYIENIPNDLRFTCLWTLLTLFKHEVYHSLDYYTLQEAFDLMPLKCKKGRLVVDKNYVQANLLKVYKMLIQNKNLKRRLGVGAKSGWYLSKQAADNGFSLPDINVVDVISSIPRVSGTVGNYSYEVLHKNDADNYYFGEYTNCCQHLTGAGRDCVLNIAQYEWASTIVLRHNGKIIAGSYLWLNKGVIIFDNIEAKVNDDTRKTVSEIYRHIVDAYSNMGFNVIIGTGYGDDLDLSVVMPGSTKVPSEILKTLRRNEIQYSDAENSIGHPNNKPWNNTTERITEVIDDQQVVIDFERVYGDVYEAQLTICSINESPDNISDDRISGNGSIRGLITAKKIIKGWEAKHPEAHLIIEASDTKRASAYRRLGFTQMSTYLYINNPWYVNNNVLTSYCIKEDDENMDKEIESGVKRCVLDSLKQSLTVFNGKEHVGYYHYGYFPYDVQQFIKRSFFVIKILFKKGIITEETDNLINVISDYQVKFDKILHPLNKYLPPMVGGQSMGAFVYDVGESHYLDLTEVILCWNSEKVRKSTKDFFATTGRRNPDKLLAMSYIEKLTEAYQNDY